MQEEILDGLAPPTFFVLEPQKECFPFVCDSMSPLDSVCSCGLERSQTLEAGSHHPPHRTDLLH